MMAVLIAGGSFANDEDYRKTVTVKVKINNDISKMHISIAVKAIRGICSHDLRLKLKNEYLN